MKIKHIVSHIEEFAPLAYQESYDNVGLLVGEASEEVSSVLLTLDVTEAVLDEAIEKKAGLIIAHHPLIFGGLKRITGKNAVERMIIKAIRHRIGIYAAHTNLDNVQLGVNHKICEKLGLINPRILAPKTGELCKLVTFVNAEDADKVRFALFDAGVGHIGDYDQCSYNLEGVGTFRGADNTNPYLGEKGKLSREKELRIESIFPTYKRAQVVRALLAAHPYEEPAYDIYALENSYDRVGAGMVADLETATPELDFLKQVKDGFRAGAIKYTTPLERQVKRVAVCGGSGSFLLPAAIGAGADVFISADFKYHQYFDADGRIVIADIGHYESEKFTHEIFYGLLSSKIPEIELYLSASNTNPIHFL